MSIPQINFDFEPGKVTREKAVVVVVVVIVFVVVVVVVVVSLAQESCLDRRDPSRVWVWQRLPKAVP